MVTFTFEQNKTTQVSSHVQNPTHDIMDQLICRLMFHQLNGNNINSVVIKK
jgi:hypothetical protein